MNKLKKLISNNNNIFGIPVRVKFGNISLLGILINKKDKIVYIPSPPSLITGINGFSIIAQEYEILKITIDELYNLIITNNTNDINYKFNTMLINYIGDKQ